MIPFPAFVDEIVKIADIDTQDAIVGGAAVSPFLGMIGQQRLKHDPLRNKNVKRMSLDDLARQAQPGDVVLTSKPKSLWKTFQAPFQGSEFYHAQPIVGRRGGRGTTASAGNYRDKYYRKQNYKDFLDEVETLGNEMKAEKYKDAIIMRPKKKMSPAEHKKFIEQSLDRVRTDYDMDRAKSSWLRDLFVPKVKPFDRGKSSKIKYKGNVPVSCEGNICSTVPAQAYSEATGRNIVRKPGSHTLPTDYLRSNEYVPVGAHISDAAQKARRIQPYLARGAMGAGLAGGAYALTEDPALAAGAAGAVGGSMLAERVMNARGAAKGLSPSKVNYPSLRTTAYDMLNADNRGQKIKALGRLAKYNLPATAAGAGLAYLGGRKLLSMARGRGEDR